MIFFEQIDENWLLLKKYTAFYSRIYWIFESINELWTEFWNEEKLLVLFNYFGGYYKLKTSIKTFIMKDRNFEIKCSENHFNWPDIFYHCRKSSNCQEHLELNDRHFSWE